MKKSKQNRMTKRIVSLLIAAVMVVTLVPTAVVPVTVSASGFAPGTHNVYIGARGVIGTGDEAGAEIFRSEPIVVRGPGTYRGTLEIKDDVGNFVEVFRFIQFAIVTDLYRVSTEFRDPFDRLSYQWATEDHGTTLQVPESWSEYVVEIDSIVVNGTANLSTPYINHFRRREDPVSNHGYSVIELWNAWWPPHNKINPVSTEIVLPAWDPDLSAWGLENGGAIRTVEVAFTVSDPANVPQLPAMTDSVGVQLVTEIDGQLVRGAATTITRPDGDAVAEYSVSLDLPGVSSLQRLAIMSEGGTFCSVMPFRRPAGHRDPPVAPAPLAWRSDAHMLIDSVVINGITLVPGQDATTRWNTLVASTIDGQNSHLVGQPSDDGTFSPIEGYVDIPLWNSFYEPSRILRGVQDVKVDLGDAEAIEFGIGMPMTNVVINFKVQFGEVVDKCALCGENSPCSLFCSSGLVTAQSRLLGGAPTLQDALAILRYTVGLSSELDSSSGGGPGTPQWNAALISEDSKRTNRPGLSDALQILRNVVNLPSDVRVRN
jgi:hypothetical protein